jgi:glycosyltransferase involved in cell wall biosynthesis
MFVMNDLLNDPRVQREARSAVRAGFSVKVVATQSDRCRVERETLDGYEVVRVPVRHFGLVSIAFRCLGLFLLIMPILKEGARWALELPPGPEAPGRAQGTPSRLRRIKWGLMRVVGLLLLPLRLVRPLLLRRLNLTHQADAPSETAPNETSRGVLRYLSETGFMLDTLWISLAMLWAARSARAAVFHGNDLPTLPVTTWAARLYGGKTLYDSHELWVGMNPENTLFFDRASRWVETRYIRRMDAVVTVNDLIADELRRRYRIPQPTVVMNCPEPAISSQAVTDHSIRATLGLSPEIPLILYQGRYEPGRGLEELIESGRYLTRGVIVLRGYGSNEDDLRRRAAELSVPGRVFLVEPVPMADLVPAAAEADVGVVPYTAYSPGYYYASPNKLFEYMMAGLAIAVSNLPVLEKIVRDHDLGVVFDPADPRHIAAQLNALVENPMRLRTCRENSARAGRERFHWNHEGGKLINLYQALSRQEMSAVQHGGSQ